MTALISGACHSVSPVLLSVVCRVAIFVCSLRVTVCVWGGRDGGHFQVVCVCGVTSVSLCRAAVECGVSVAEARTVCETTIPSPIVSTGSW